MEISISENSVPNYCQSVCPKQTTLEEDRCHMEIWPHGNLTRGSLFYIEYWPGGHFFIMEKWPPGQFSMESIFYLTPGTFLKIFFNFMFMIWDSRQEGWQLFWLSFEHCLRITLTKMWCCHRWFMHAITAQHKTLIFVLREHLFIWIKTAPCLH